MLWRSSRQTCDDSASAEAVAATDVQRIRGYQLAGVGAYEQHRLADLVGVGDGSLVVASLSLKVDPKNTIENLPTLGKRLTLQKGWNFRARKLEKEMTLTSTADSNLPNSIVLDQFEGNYQYNAGASAAAR